MWTVSTPAENWQQIIDHSLQSQRASKLQTMLDFKLKRGTFVCLQRARTLHSTGKILEKLRFTQSSPVENNKIYYKI